MFGKVQEDKKSSVAVIFGLGPAFCTVMIREQPSKSRLVVFTHVGTDLGIRECSCSVQYMQSSQVCLMKLSLKISSCSQPFIFFCSKDSLYLFFKILLEYSCFMMLC